MGESGWNNFARNPSSGAFGIPQALPPGKMGAAAAGGNAAAQIAWGLSYIKSVYGSPANAYAKWLARSPHWYDTGGYARGEGWFRKGPAPERILSPTQTKWFERAMMSAAGLVVTAPVASRLSSVPRTYVGSRDELLRELNRMAKQGRLDAVVRLAN
jgi:SLT domain-containing protein